MKVLHKKIKWTKTYSRSSAPAQNPHNWQSKRGAFLFYVCDLEWKWELAVAALLLALLKIAWTVTIKIINGTPKMIDTKFNDARIGTIFVQIFWSPITFYDRQVHYVMLDPLMILFNADVCWRLICPIVSTFRFNHLHKPLRNENCMNGALRAALNCRSLFVSFSWVMFVRFNWMSALVPSIIQHHGRKNQENYTVPGRVCAAQLK